MRDIKRNKKESSEFNLPPLGGDDYKDLELYEASLSTKKESEEKQIEPVVEVSRRRRSRRLDGNSVPVAKINVNKNKVKGQLREERAKFEKRPMFVKADSKKPGKVRVGKGERKTMVALLGLLVVAAVIAAVIFLPTATIDLRLRAAPLLVDDIILIGSNESAEKTVPGTSFYREILVGGSQKVQNTEVVGNKSKGEVVIVNKTLSEQKIKERSRLVTDGGVLFYMEKHAIVPPDSRVKVTVEAAEEGDEGNIEPQKLEFVALDDASRKIVYAEATNTFTGGSGETIAVVSGTDIQEARKEALKNAKEQASEQIRGELPEGWVLLEESWDLVTDDFSTEQKEGDKIPVIDYKSRVTAKVMGYEKAIFEERMKARLEDKINDDYMLFPGPISFTQSVEAVNWDEAESTVNIRVTHSTIPKIALDSLKEKLAGRTSDEAREYLEGLPGVRSASMKLWPFWVGSIPRIEKRINVNLESEKKI